MSFGSFDKDRFAVQAHDKFIVMVDKSREEVRRSNPGAPAAMHPLNGGLTVVARKRPLNDSERALGQYDVISCPDGLGVIVHEPRVKYDLSQAVVNHGFGFDRVYDETSGCMDLYAELLRPFVLNLDRGAQLTAFCYGQTGSGKSFTMGGLVDAALEDAFRLITAASTRARGLCVCLSYFEIYCNQVFDLLAARTPLALREDAAGNCQVVGLVEHSTRDIRIARELLARGTAARSIGMTKVNADSSRSHSVLQILVREGGRGGGSLVGKASLVDLAGSEQASESAPPDKATHHEAAEINKSLLALKECIRAMGRGAGGRAASTASDGGSTLTRGSTDEESMGSLSSVQYAEGRGAGKGARQGKSGRGRAKHVHVPFRGSKLTQLLRDSFTSPGAATVMISTVGPGNVAADHSLNTLRYADRLKALGGRRQVLVAGGPPPAENSAGVRVGLLGSSKREVVEGGFTHTNPKVHAPPPGMRGEGEGAPLSRRLMPTAPSWAIGGVAPDEVWAANDAVIAAMRREMEHAQAPPPVPVVQRVEAVRSVARPHTSAGGRQAVGAAPPLPPSSSRAVPRGVEARGAPFLPVPAPAARPTAAAPAPAATPPGPVSPPSRTRREVGAGVRASPSRLAPQEEVRPVHRTTPTRGGAAAGGSSSELVALLDAQIGHLAALRARMASSAPSAGGEAEQAALIASLSRDALMRARPSRDGALLAALASASASADAINESVSLTLQTSMSGSEAALAPPALPAPRRTAVPLPVPSLAARAPVPRQRLGPAAQPPSAPAQRPERPSPYSQRVAVAVGPARPSTTAAPLDARAKGRSSLTPPSTARTPHGQGVSLPGPSLPSGSPKPARKAAPVGTGRGGWDAKLLGSPGGPPAPLPAFRGPTLAFSVSASALAAAYRTAGSAGEELEGPRRVTQGSGPDTFAMARVK